MTAWIIWSIRLEKAECQPSLRRTSYRKGEEHYEKDFLNGVVVLDVPAKKVVQKNDLYYKVALDGEDTILKMIPYYAWANRDEADMSVWFPKA